MICKNLNMLQYAQTMQSCTINLSEIQTSYILPLLDDLHISYAPNEQMQDFMKDLQGKYAN